MSLFDDVKDHILGMVQQIRPDEPDQRYFDEYEGAYADDKYAQVPADAYGTYDAQGAPFENNGVASQAAYGARPPQESVSVFTRSGRPVDDSTPLPSEGSFSSAQSFEKEVDAMEPSLNREGYEEPASLNATASFTPIDIHAASSDAYTNYEASAAGASAGASAGAGAGASAGAGAAAATTQKPYAAVPTSVAPSVYSAQGLHAVPRPSSGKLPPYTIKPTSYEDAQLVARRVQTNQPVVVLFRNTPLDTAKRMLDFCFGFAYGINGQVKEIASRTFVVLPAGLELSQDEIEKIKSENNLN